MNTENLIEDLARDLKPVRPVQPLGRLTLLFSLGFVCFDLGLLFIVRVRPDFFERISSFVYISEAILPLFLMISCVMLVDYLSLPGRAALKWPWRSIWILIAAIFGVEIWHAVQDGAEVMAGLNVSGVKCSIMIAIVSIIPMILLIAAAKRRAVTQLRLTGAMLALAGVSVGLIEIALHCPIDNVVHISLWHWILPLSVCVVLGSSLLSKLLRW